METRNYKIKELRLLKKWPISKIALKYGVTTERVRQIVAEEDKDKIRKVIAQRYTQKFKNDPSFNDLIQDIEILSRASRKKENVIKRRILIRYLYDELGIPFEKIGFLLDRDHTSVMNLYYER
jgi:chromosomal replication initiation ATPase DnaA